VLKGFFGFLSVSHRRSFFTNSTAVLPLLSSRLINHQALPQNSGVSHVGASHTVTPRVITVDKNAAYPKAIKELQTARVLAVSCELRQSKYLNNLIEQDHRFIKRLVKPGMGFFSFETAWRTLQGYEVIHMMRKGQMQGVSRGDSLSQAAFIAELFGVAI